jgi:hypothetical protein
MGNNNGRHKNNKKAIHRDIGEVANQYPEVDTLKLSFKICRNIFVNIPLKDIASCMLVCKEWRSLIDTCAFYKAYMYHHYDFELKEPPRSSPLNEWKSRSNCLKTDINLNNRIDPHKPNHYVFKPFPDIWKCNMVVPYALAPPQGAINIYHNFLQALRWLERLDEKLIELDKGLTMHCCLIPWFKERMPTSREVLAILGSHKEITRTLVDASPLTKQEMKIYYGMLKNRYKGVHFDSELYDFFLGNVKEKSIIFDCNVDIVDPVPSFILSKISDGWVGGLIYSI